MTRTCYPSIPAVRIDMSHRAETDTLSPRRAVCSLALFPLSFSCYDYEALRDLSDESTWRGAHDIYQETDIRRERCVFFCRIPRELTNPQLTENDVKDENIHRNLTLPQRSLH